MPRGSVTKLPNWSSMCLVIALMCILRAETDAIDNFNGASVCLLRHWS